MSERRPEPQCDPIGEMVARATPAQILRLLWDIEIGRPVTVPDGRRA